MGRAVVSAIVVVTVVGVASAARGQASEPEADREAQPEAEPETEPETEPEPETEDAGEGEGGETARERAERLQAPPPDPAKRVAVLLLAARGVDPETADALTEVAIGALAARGGATILGKEEFQAQLGQGEARSMECVTSTACLGRVGVELGVDEVIAGTINKRGAAWVFNIDRKSVV